ncbi:hypothetical protein ACOMICROBIO_GDFFDHBD_03001 [Vibrio sp. B1REV9]|nr:hypothetical protein ACOMICROBIO_GDFFDHBD_03001 [Vibrio sp. B1REV9]
MLQFPCMIAILLRRVIFEWMLWLPMTVKIIPALLNYNILNGELLGQLLLGVLFFSI